MNITQQIDDAKIAQDLFKLINLSYFHSFSGFVVKAISKTILTKKKGWTLLEYDDNVESSTWKVQKYGETTYCLIEADNIGFFCNHED